MSKSDCTFDQSLRRNQEATELMKTGNYSDALALLHSVEHLSSRPLCTQREQQLHRVILNNLGCCYMKGRQLPLAVQYLTKALETESNGTSEQAVGMRINLSSVYYQLRDYNQALVEALKSLHVLETRQRSRRESRLYAKSLNCAGMAYEALAHRRKALLHYFRAITVASDCLGANHDLTQAIKARYDSLCKAKDHFATSDSEGALMRMMGLSATPLFTKVAGARKRRKSYRPGKLSHETVGTPTTLRSPNMLKTSSTPMLKSRLRLSPCNTQMSSTAASSKDLGIPRISQHSVARSPDSRLIRTRLRTPSEGRTVNKSGSSDMESRLHSIDEKLLTLTQRLCEYGWKNSEMRKIAEKAGSISGVTTPPEESVDERTAGAIVIQRWYRGLAARKRFQCELKRKPQAVTTVAPSLPLKKHKKVVLSSTKRSGRITRYSMYHAK